MLRETPNAPCFRWILRVLALTLLCVSASSAKPCLLRVVAAEHYHPPFWIQDSKVQKPRGMIPDLLNALNKDFRCQIAFVSLPRKRVADFMSRGLVDVIPRATPLWYPNLNMEWSNPWLTENDVLVIQKNNPWKPSHINDLKGKRIGTLLGFVYPEFDSLFRHGLLQRDDASSIDANFNKLKLGRVDAVIQSYWISQYQMLKPKSRAQLEIRDIGLKKNALQFGIHPDSPIAKEQWNRALEKIERTGELQRILNRYTHFQSK
jgi:polar amino acid transport system substrate-binding protein